MSDVDQEWGPDHPCYYGHKTVEDPLKCGRCGAELERNPSGKWRELGERSTESSDQNTTAESGVNVQNA